MRGRKACCCCCCCCEYAARQTFFVRHGFTFCLCKKSLRVFLYFSAFTLQSGGTLCKVQHPVNPLSTIVVFSSLTVFSHIFKLSPSLSFTLVPFFWHFPSSSSSYRFAWSDQGNTAVKKKGRRALSKKS